jgi:hypothetical protein
MPGNEVSDGRWQMAVLAARHVANVVAGEETLHPPH